MEDGPSYVPHTGASPMEVVELIGAAGGVSSLAHPGYGKQDDVIGPRVDAGLVAIEAFHSPRPAPSGRYLEVARSFDLAVSGGSDYHGAGTRRAEFFGVTHLPEADYEMLCERSSRAREHATQRLAIAWAI